MTLSSKIPLAFLPSTPTINNLCFQKRTTGFTHSKHPLRLIHPSKQPCVRPRPWPNIAKIPGMSAVDPTVTPVSQSIPLSPDDTAVDMLTFALSGPGIIAFFALLSFAAFLFLSFAELGPLLTGRDTSSSGALPKLTRPFILQVRLQVPHTIEFPDGVARTIARGENIFRFESQQAADAVAKRLRKAPNNRDVHYELFRLDGIAVRTLAKWPKNINVSGAIWPSELDDNNDDDEYGVNLYEDENIKNPEQIEKERIWDAYQRAGEIGKVDREWQKFVKSLGGVSIERPSENACKLCGGAGFTRCYRCGGASKTSSNAQFSCDCIDGCRPCEWCKSTPPSSG